MKKIMYQHGDVILKQSVLPKGIKLKKVKKGFVIEKGEGVHTHTLKEGELNIGYKDGIMYLVADAPVKIDHEEHGVEILEPGILEKEIERRWDYEEEEAKKVID